MASIWYDAGGQGIATGVIDLANDSFKMMLATSSYTIDRATHIYRSSVTNEVTGTNYTAGGVALTGLSYTKDTTNHRSVWAANNISFASLTIGSPGARYGIIYKSRGGAATADELVMLYDFLSAQTPTNQTLTVTGSPLMYLNF